MESANGFLVGNELIGTDRRDDLAFHTGLLTQLAKRRLVGGLADALVNSTEPLRVDEYQGLRAVFDGMRIDLKMRLSRDGL